MTPDDDCFVAILKTDWHAFQKDLAEAQRREELMRPVVEKARTLVGCWREEPVVADSDWISDEAQALTDAVDTYETQTGGTE